MAYNQKIKTGSRVEREHLPFFHKIKKGYMKTGKCPSDKQFTEGIAKAHIQEDKKYYTKLKKAGL